MLAGEAGFAVFVCVAGSKSFKYDRGFILYLLVLHVESVVLVDSLPSGN